MCKNVFVQCKNSNPFENNQKGFKATLKIIIYKKEMEILNLQVELDDYLKIKKDIQKLI